MKYREHTAPLLDPEAYIHLWKVAVKPKQPPVRMSRSAWDRIRAFVKSFEGKGSSGGALWLALLLVACSPKPEPRAIDHESLVWVQPKQNDKPKAGTLPRFAF